MKIALISHALPPSWSGQSMAIYRLLAGLSSDRYCLISTRPYGFDEDRTHYLPDLPGSRHQIPPIGFQIHRAFRYGMLHVNFWLAILQRARFLSGVFKRERCDAVVACTGDVLDMPAAYLASRLRGIPFFPYIFDHYSKRERFEPLARVWSRKLEPWLLRGAKKVIVPNEILRDDIMADYEVESVVIHNSCDTSAYMTELPASTHEAGVKIVYTGDVYEANADAFRNLLTAIESLNRSDVKLHLYSARPKEALDYFGIRGPMINWPHQSPSKAVAVQRTADVLFLPLAFNSPYPDVIRTSATSKVGEYMAARRPILVHAPADSFVAWYFRHYDCGLVVDRDDPAELAKALELLLSDRALCERLVAHGWERSRLDFDIEVARKKFWGLLEENVKSGAPLRRSGQDAQPVAVAGDPKDGEHLQKIERAGT
jgi:glycosyltransferase involved in cell wall biosynthesis